LEVSVKATVYIDTFEGLSLAIEQPISMISTQVSFTDCQML